MVEENTTTCACQGGWMCPNCADQHRAEISRLKAELEDNNAHRHELQEANKSLRSQLTEARAENEALKRVVSSTERWENLDDQLQQARQEAARECAEIADQYKIIDNDGTEILYGKAIGDDIRITFKLGVRNDC